MLLFVCLLDRSAANIVAPKNLISPKNPSLYSDVSALSILGPEMAAPLSMGAWHFLFPSVQKNEEKDSHNEREIFKTNKSGGGSCFF